jgi:EEF1A N-terminal glycine/lysine methyltransferase
VSHVCITPIKLIGFSELNDTESAHKEALLEMEKMRETMKRMEEERLQMVAEIEQSIEQALVSMTVGFTESDYGDSRPSSRLSSFSGTRSRRASDATRMKSFGTDSTLAESYDELKEDARGIRSSDTIEEEDEQEHSPLPNLNPKRFSASRVEMPQDTMAAVDEGISERSDKITQKVLEIQQKVCVTTFYIPCYMMYFHQLEDALNAEHSTGHRGRRAVRRDSDEETVNSTRSLNRAPHPHSKITGTRSGASSTPRARTRTSSQTEKLAHSRLNVHAPGMLSSADKGDTSESRTAAPLTLGIANSTDDDDGFYSASPGGFDDEDDSDGKYTKLKSTSPPSSRRSRRKERLSRTSTTTTETTNDSSIA